MGGSGAGDDRHVTDTRETGEARRVANDRKLPQIDLKRSPFTVAWEITRACALACLHCRAATHAS